MLIIQKDISMVNEARETGKGNRIWIEVLKFLVISTVVNLLIVFLAKKS